MEYNCTLAANNIIAYVHAIQEPENIYTITEMLEVGVNYPREKIMKL